MNGADDVVKYSKYLCRTSTNARFITMGRPGSTEAVIRGMATAGKALDDPFFIIGPELQDCSSSQARHALVADDLVALCTLLDPLVMEWCLQEYKVTQETHYERRGCSDSGEFWSE